MTKDRTELGPAGTAAEDVAWHRGREVTATVLDRVLLPLAAALLAGESPAGNGTAFWEAPRPDRGGRSHADLIVGAVEELGCTYVKFGQALASRPDLVPAPLARALSKLQDDMEPFPTDAAREIIRRELRESSGVSEEDLELLLSSLSPAPVAAASIGQVYKAYYQGAPVAVKIRRPGIHATIARDAALLRDVARRVEALRVGSRRLVKAQLVDAVGEFMRRLEEELDYRREAGNIRAFGALYSHRRTDLRRNRKVQVVVPHVLDHLCTDNVLVMEWIEGTKLTDVDHHNKAQVQENLSLIQMGIECTLSQLLETGILHADPHTANLIRVPEVGGTGVRLGYLDFGLLSSVPESVRDALVCSVAQLVFARDVQAVADLFGELQLLPQHVLEDSDRRLALAQALESTFHTVLEYPKQTGGDNRSPIPILKFDRLLESLAGILPEFEFKLPPYFLSNCRALAIMEGNARMLDPQFNVLRVLYPYALNRLLSNPSDSPVVEATVWSLLTDPRTNTVDTERILKLLDDSAALTGYPRRKVLLDILRTRHGRFLARKIVTELTKSTLSGRGRRQIQRIIPGSYFRL